MSPDQQIMPGTEDTIGSLRQTLSAISLPVEARQRDRLIRYVDSDLLSFTELTRELMRVPVAALQVCRAAGETARPRDLDILTLEQACGLLGTQRLRTLLKNLPTAPLEAMPLAYRQFLSISEHALLQSQGLFAHRMARLWHELSLASLLFLAPCWVLVYHRPQLFEHWDAAHLQPGSGSESGPLDSSHLLTLAQQLAEDWWLPPWILQGYRSLGSSRRLMVKAIHIARDATHPQEQQAALDADRGLSRWLTQPANGPLLANGIALGAHHNWDARHTRRWQQLAALYLGCSLAETQAASHINAAGHAQAQTNAAADGLWYPAEALIWPTGTRCRERSRAQPEATSHAGDPQLWRQHCLYMLQEPTPFPNLPAVLDSAMKAITQGLGVKQCWIALYNGQQHQLMISASNFSISDRRLLGSLLGPCRNNAWSDWLLTRRCHDLDQAARDRHADLIPGALLASTGDSAFHLLPLTHNGQVIGLVQASLGQGDQLLDERRSPALVKTVECLHKALMNFRQHG